MKKNKFRDICYVKPIKQQNNKNFFIYIIISFFIYFFFCFIYGFNQIILAKTNNIENIQNIILKLRLITISEDNELSRFLGSISNIISQFKNNKRPFYKKNGNFRIILNYLSNHDIPNIVILDKYKDFLKFTKQLIDIEKQVGYKDIFKILEPGNTYLVILENIGEIRPNGGFFGSYGVLKIFNTGFNISIFDSYFTIHVKKIHLPIKENFLQKLVNGNRINFISPNIRGFSNIDGKNIKTLYEKTFTGTKINGIIFIKSSLFENLDENLRNQIYEWQFVNASIDLIRGKKLPFKKEIYLKQINSFIKENKFKILKQIVKNRKQIIQNGQIYLYLPNISNQLEKFLEKNNLIFVRKPNCFYFFDFNFGYNKIDRFLEKNIFLISGENVLYHIKNKNILCFKKTNTKDLKIKIIYTLKIPQYYFEFIKELEKKYHIKLTPREKAILGLNPYVKNKGIIYRPEFYKRYPTVYSYYITGNNKTSIIEIK